MDVASPERLENMLHHFRGYSWAIVRNPENRPMCVDIPIEADADLSPTGEFHAVADEVLQHKRKKICVGLDVSPRPTASFSRNAPGRTMRP